jgi:hypothetical protein
MKAKITAIVVALAMVCSLGVAFTVPAGAVTPAQIEFSVSEGCDWLANTAQNDDGSWGTSDQTAVTLLALIKLQERGKDLGYDSPFDPAYEYSDDIVEGWEYIFEAGQNRVVAVPIDVQDHTALPHGSGTMDDPDSDGDGIGASFETPVGGHPTYTTGIALMALEASCSEDRVNDGGLDLDGDGNADTFGELCQDAVDFLAWGQADTGASEGGWDYGPIDDGVPAGTPDQSNSGYAVLGLAAAQQFGCTVPQWVKDELDLWITACQHASGGSIYEPGWNWLNLLKAGNLIFEMKLVGDDVGTARFQNALGFIEDNWHNQVCCGDLGGDNVGGWGYTQDPACYQAMYCLMKGLVYSGIELLDLDGDTVRDENWFNQEPAQDPPEDFASAIVEQQNPDGSWDDSCWGSDITNTVWALLTLEKVAPTVGGVVEPVNSTELAATYGELSDGNSSYVWLALGAGLAFVLAIGGGVFVLRRQRAK